MPAQVHFCSSWNPAFQGRPDRAANRPHEGSRTGPDIRITPPRGIASRIPAYPRRSESMSIPVPSGPAPPVIAGLAASSTVHDVKLDDRLSPRDRIHKVGERSQAQDPTTQADDQRLCRRRLTADLSGCGKVKEVWLGGRLIFDVGDDPTPKSMAGSGPHQAPRRVGSPDRPTLRSLRQRRLRSGHREGSTPADHRIPGRPGDQGIGDPSNARNAKRPESCRSVSTCSPSWCQSTPSRYSRRRRPPRAARCRWCRFRSARHRSREVW